MYNNSSLVERYIYIYKEYEGGMVATIHVKEVNDSLYFFIIFIFKVLK
jgi:hypothetical protein